MDKTNVSDQQAENLIRRSLTNHVAKEPERSHTFFAIHDRLNEQTGPSLWKRLSGISELALWRIIPLSKQRTAQLVVLVGIVVVIGVYMASIGSDEYGGGSVVAEPTITPTLVPPEVAVDASVLEIKPIPSRILDRTNGSASETQAIWHEYFSNTRWRFGPETKPFLGDMSTRFIGDQEWAVCEDGTGHVISDTGNAVSNAEEWFEWSVSVSPVDSIMRQIIRVQLVNQKLDLFPTGSTDALNGVSAFIYIDTGFLHWSRTPLTVLDASGPGEGCK